MKLEDIKAAMNEIAGNPDTSPETIRRLAEAIVALHDTVKATCGDIERLDRLNIERSTRF